MTARELGFATGHAMYEKLSNSQKAVISYGMTPIECVAEALKDAVIEEEERREYELGVTLGLLKAAAKAGNLLV